MHSHFPPNSSKMWRAHLPSCQMAPHTIIKIKAPLNTEITKMILNLFSSVVLLDTILLSENIAFSRPPDFNYFFAKSKRTLVQFLFDARRFLARHFCNFLVFKNPIIFNIVGAILLSFFRPKIVIFYFFSCFEL